jgi:hypothetical protein
MTCACGPSRASSPIRRLLVGGGGGGRPRVQGLALGSGIRRVCTQSGQCAPRGDFGRGRPRNGPRGWRGRSEFMEKGGSGNVRAPIGHRADSSGRWFACRAVRPAQASRARTAPEFQIPVRCARSRRSLAMTVFRTSHPCPECGGQLGVQRAAWGGTVHTQIRTYVRICVWFVVAGVGTGAVDA